MGVLRRLLQVLLIVATLLVGATAAVIIVSQTAWFRDWLRGLIVRQANQYMNAQLSIGRLGGNLFFGLEFEDLGVTKGGERVIAVRHAGIDYSVIQFISGDIVIDHIRLDRPLVTLKREASGWNVGQLVKKQKQEKKRSGPGRPITIGEIGISDGTFVLDRGEDGEAVGTSGRGDESPGGVQLPRRIARIDARLSFKYEPVHYTVDIAHVSLRGSEPEFALNDLSGTVSTRNENLYLDKLAIRTAESSLEVDGQVQQFGAKPALKIEATSDKLAIPEIARLVPALRGIDLQPALRVKASGPLDRVAFDFAVKSSAGDASGQVTADLVGREHGIKGEVHLKGFDLAPIVRNAAAKSDLTGVARMDVRFPTVAARGPVAGSFSVSTFSARIAGYRADQIEARGRVDGKRVSLDQAKAVAYGAAATAAGTVEPGVQGPKGEPGLALDLHGSVAGLDLRRLPATLKVPPFDSRLTFDYQVNGVGAALSGQARLRPSVLAGAELADQTVGTFSSAGPAIEYSAEGGIANFDIQRYGRVLKIAALAADRFKSDINGRFSARGSGTSVATLTLDANAALNNSTLDTVVLPLLGVEAHLADGGGRFRADGGFFNLDPARFTGNARTKGNVAGRVAVEASLASLSGPMTPDSVAASGEVVLHRSNVGGLDIEKARVAGNYANSGGQLDEATVAGRDLSFKASGGLALGDSGSSTLSYHFETPDIGALGKLAGQDQLEGFLSLDGRLTGNRSNLGTQGQLKAGNLRYGATEVLTAQSAYEATLPEFDTARAQVKADTTLGFLKAGGQDINAVRATTTYGESKLAFDATIEQAVRNGKVVGTLLLHPDHQEVHLSQFGLTTQGVSWGIAPGTEPVVQYGGDAVTLKGIHLVSGTQSIVAEGTIGPKASNVRAALTGVDLARVDTLLIGDRRLGGILNAAATVTGPSSALNVSSDFSIDGGAFREFRYDTLGGNVTYGQDRLALDVRLQQNRQAWLFAKGTLPIAFFGSPTTPSGAPARGSDAPVDLTVRSSAIDLGVVQGFTSAITKASGTMIADAHLGGTAGKPEMSGRVEVSNGAFTVVPAGVAYKAVNGRIDLQPGRAVIDRLSATDEHDRTMGLSGEMGLHGRSLGALKLKVTSNKFEVLHNDLGRVTMDSEVDLGGDMRAPEIRGNVAVNTATINLDRVLELATSSAYSTRPQSTGAAAGEPAAGAQSLAAADIGSVPGGTEERGQTNASGNAAATQPAGAGGGPETPAAPASSAQAASSPQSGAGPRAQGQGTQASGGIFDAALIDVTLKVPDDLVLNGKDIQPGNTPIGLGNVNVTVGADLRISKRPALPMRFTGPVNMVRGTYEFQGRRFDIERGGLARFVGGIPPDPSLDISATRLISGVETRVHIGGTMSKPELTLTSNPPLEQADILSLIIFNQPANDLGEGQQASLAQRASAIATGFVAGKLADSIGKALSLDLFEIQTEASAGGGQAASVTVGEQVGRNLYFKVIQGVGSDTTSQFVLDYQLADFMRLETSVSQGTTAMRTLTRREQSGVDLIFFFSY